VYKVKLIGLKNIGKVSRPVRILIFIITFIITYLLLMSSLITKKYSLAVGDIAKFNIKATREMIDKNSTEKKIKLAEASVGEKYEKKPEVKTGVVEDIRSFFMKIDSVKLLELDEQQKIDTLKPEVSIVLKDEEYAELLKLNYEDLRSLEEFLIEEITRIYDNMTINNGNKEDLEKATENLVAGFNNSDMIKKLKVIGINIGTANIKPNFFYDKEKTEIMKKEATESVSPEIIKKDQIIVKEGEPVTFEQINILKEMGLLNNDPKTLWYIYISLGILVFTIITLQWYYLYKYYRNTFDNSRKLALISMLSCISILLARTLSLISPFLIPFACAPMLFTLLINYKISLTLNVINLILISGVVGFNIEITLIAALNAVLGSMVLRKLQARNDILYSSILIAVINIIITLTIGIILSNNTMEIIKKTGYSGLSGILSAILTIGFLPLFEGTFDIITTIKLLELSNPNQPLLKKLLVEAPGTYHHSIMVANLAEFASEEVGGNSVLARVGAYYHDVGKIKRPYFFKENQFGNDNPHNKITPGLSSVIITSHVKDGIDLAKEYNVPEVIRDIIEQHHGNSVVKYFYITAKNLSTSPEEVKEEDFRYPGPIPKSKEAAIIMLADCVEAAVRSISEPTTEKIENMVNNIVKDRLNDGQLYDCNLTLRDIEKIRKAFLKSLSGIYHQRIEYPTDKTLKKTETKV
jgi:cyclic-di-AMP phosphodiesterase PgpH